MKMWLRISYTHSWYGTPRFMPECLHLSPCQMTDFVQENSLQLTASAIHLPLMRIFLTSSIFVAQIGESPQVSQSDQCPCHSKQELQLVCPLATVQKLGFAHQSVILPRRLATVSLEEFPWHGVNTVNQWNLNWSLYPPCIYSVAKPMQLWVRQRQNNSADCLAPFNSFI